jgi:hypothetical protein
MSDLQELVEADKEMMLVEDLKKSVRQLLLRGINWNDSNSLNEDESFSEILFFCPVYNNPDECEVTELVLRPTGTIPGQYQRVGNLHIARDSIGFSMPKLCFRKLDEVFFHKLRFGRRIHNRNCVVNVVALTCFLPVLVATFSI